MKSLTPKDNINEQNQIINLSEFRKGMADMKNSLMLLQAAGALAAEGSTRATASQIAARVAQLSGVSLAPAVVGQLLASLRLPVITSHGKRRFVIEPDNLAELIDQLNVQYRTLADRLAVSQSDIETLAHNIATLNDEWQTIIDLKTRETALRIAISQTAATAAKIPPLVNRLNHLQEQAAEAIELEEACETLTAQIKSIPQLNKRKAALEARAEKCEAEDNDLTSRERELAPRLARLKERRGWLSLLDLEQAIDEAQRELAQLSGQLGEKRSLLDRLRNRKAGGS